MSLNRSMIDLTTSVYRLNRIIADYTQRLIESEGIKDLQPSAGVILLPLLEKEGQTLSELARTIYMKAPTITVIANRLEDSKLIRRERGSSDRRQVHLYLTKEGKRVAETLRDIRTKISSQLASGLSKATINKSTDTLEKVISNVSTKVY